MTIYECIIGINFHEWYRNIHDTVPPVKIDKRKKYDISHTII